jgi:hypothetical protein
MTNDGKIQAIPLDYHAYEKALENVRRMIASARKLGQHREVAELEKRVFAAQKALAEFDALNVRDALK